MIFYKAHYFFVAGFSGHRECLKERKYCRSVLKHSTSDFSDNERMTDNLSVVQQGYKLRISFLQVSDPYGSINENHL